MSHSHARLAEGRHDDNEPPPRVLLFLTVTPSPNGWFGPETCCLLLCAHDAPILGEAVQTEDGPGEVLAPACLVAENRDGPVLGLLDFERQLVRSGRACPSKEQQLL